jgi:hypothetical protein
MATDAGDGPILLIKKLGGLFLIVLGCVCIAAGASYPSTDSWLLASCF